MKQAKKRRVWRRKKEVSPSLVVTSGPINSEFGEAGDGRYVTHSEAA